MLRYAPKKWNSCQHQTRNNCYNYALNLLDDTFRQPGEKSDFTTTKKDSCYDGKLVEKAAIADGWVKKEEPDGQCPKGYHKVCLTICSYDYHWLRQDSNGYWSHKMGYLPATDLSAITGEKITDPVAEARHFGYTDYASFLCALDNPEDERREQNDTRKHA